MRHAARSATTKPSSPNWNASGAASATGASRQPPKLRPVDSRHCLRRLRLPAGACCHCTAAACGHCGCLLPLRRPAATACCLLSLLPTAYFNTASPWLVATTTRLPTTATAGDCTTYALVYAALRAGTEHVSVVRGSGGEALTALLAATTDAPRRTRLAELLTT